MDSAAYTDPQLKLCLDVLNRAVPQSERTVRTESELAVLAETGSVLASLEPLQASLLRLNTSVQTCTQVHSSLLSLTQSCANDTQHFFTEATKHANSRKTAENQLAVLQTFVKECRVTSEDARVLEMPMPELTPEFFEALERVKRVQQQIGVMLLVEAPQVGEQLMQESTKILNTAYQKIFTAVQSALKQGQSQSARKLLSLLADRPMLFKQVLVSENASLRAQLVRDFEKFAAGEHATARIAPQRYLGSVLAFLHANVVNEYENINLLLDSENDNDSLNVSSGSNGSNGSNETQTVSSTVVDELVDDIVSGLEVPLRQNLNAVIVSQISAPLIDEMQHVLKLYKSMLQKYALPSVTKQLSQIEDSLNRQFVHCVAFIRDWETAVDVAYALLVQNDEGVARNDAETADKVRQILMPSWTKFYTPLQSEASKQGSIEVMNLVDTAVMRLAGFEPAQSCLDYFQETSDTHAAQLSDLLANELVLTSGLGKGPTNQSNQSNKFNKDNYDSQMFDAFLASASAVLQEMLEPLSSPMVSSAVYEQAVAKFVDQYAQLPPSSDMPSVDTVRLLF